MQIGISRSIWTLAGNMPQRRYEFERLDRSARMGYRIPEIFDSLHKDRITSKDYQTGLVVREIYQAGTVAAREAA